MSSTTLQLGAGPSVAGCTVYCTEPPEGVAAKTRVGGPKKQVFLVHGEPERSEAFRAALAPRHPTGTVRAARLHESVTL